MGIDGLSLVAYNQGVPMMLMGDEYGHTRYGNNNSYGHDTAINHFQWGHVCCRNAIMCIVN